MSQFNSPEIETNLTPEEIAAGNEWARRFDAAQEALRSLRACPWPCTYSIRDQINGRDYLEQAQDLLADAWAPEPVEEEFDEWEPERE